MLVFRKISVTIYILPISFSAAFFHGQVEQPVRGLMSLVNHRDVSVIIAINERGVFIIDPVECVRLVLLHFLFYF